MMKNNGMLIYIFLYKYVHRNLRLARPFFTRRAGLQLSRAIRLSPRVVLISRTLLIVSPGLAFWGSRRESRRPDVSVARYLIHSTVG